MNNSLEELCAILASRSPDLYHRAYTHEEPDIAVSYLSQGLNSVLDYPPSVSGSQITAYWEKTSTNIYRTPLGGILIRRSWRRGLYIHLWYFRRDGETWRELIGEELETVISDELMLAYLGCWSQET